jgi:hypothetical protein
MALPFLQGSRRVLLRDLGNLLCPLGIAAPSMAKTGQIPPERLEPLDKRE